MRLAMKKLLFAMAGSVFLVGSPAFSADLPVKAYKAPMPAELSWTGFYIGGHLGGGRVST
jgi:hypothetical protein